VAGNGPLSGPATRPKTPLAVENSVGKLAKSPGKIEVRDARIKKKQKVE
jgi:hypothetical protein